VRVPGTWIYGTRVVCGATPTPQPTALDPVLLHVANLVVQFAKLGGLLFVIGAILSVITTNIALRFDIVGAFFVGLLAPVLVGLPGAIIGRNRL